MANLLQNPQIKKDVVADLGKEKYEEIVAKSHKIHKTAVALNNTGTVSLITAAVSALVAVVAPEASLAQLMFLTLMGSTCAIGMVANLISNIKIEKRDKYLSENLAPALNKAILRSNGYEKVSSPKTADTAQQVAKTVEQLRGITAESRPLSVSGQIQGKWWEGFSR